MSKREFTLNELTEILEINETRPLTSSDDPGVWKKRKQRREIIGGLLKNRVMVGVFFYMGLVNATLRTYPNTVNFLVPGHSDSLSFTTSEIIGKIAEEMKSLEGIPPTNLRSDAIFREHFLDLNLITRIPGKPGHFRTNIVELSDHKVIPRSVAMNYLEEDINAIKSAVQSLSKFRDTITSYRLPLVKAYRNENKSFLRLNDLGNAFWRYVWRQIHPGSSSLTDLSSLTSIHDYHQVTRKSLGIRNKLQGLVKDVRQIYIDIDLRIKDLNHKRYPLKKMKRYYDRASIRKELQEKRRGTETEEYLYQRLDTALQKIISLQNYYNYLRDVRNRLSIITDELRIYINKIQSHLRIFQSLRDIDEFPEKLKLFKDNYDSLENRELEIPKILPYYDWNEKKEVQQSSFESNLDMRIIQAKDLAEEEEIIPAEWISRIMETLINTQNVQKELEPILEELTREGELIL